MYNLSNKYVNYLLDTMRNMLLYTIVYYFTIPVCIITLAVYYLTISQINNL